MSKLGLVAQAPNKETVQRIFEQAFLFRHDNARSFLVGRIAEDLSISKAEAEDFSAELIQLIKDYLYHDVQNDQLLGFLPSGLDDATKKLIGRILVSRRDDWNKECINRCAAIFNQLQDFNWAVNLKTASNDFARMSTPSVVLTLSIANPPDSQHSLPYKTVVDLELNHARLKTVLEGLRHIRDTLANVQ